MGILIAKILAGLLTGISGIVGIISDFRKHGRITRIGILSAAGLALGLALATFVEFYEGREALQRAEREARAARLAAERAQRTGESVERLLLLNSAIEVWMPEITLDEEALPELTALKEEVISFARPLFDGDPENDPEPDGNDRLGPIVFFSDESGQTVPGEIAVSPTAVENGQGIIGSQKWVGSIRLSFFSEEVDLTQYRPNITPCTVCPDLTMVLWRPIWEKRADDDYGVFVSFELPPFGFDLSATSPVIRGGARFLSDQFTDRTSKILSVRDMEEAQIVLSFSSSSQAPLEVPNLQLFLGPRQFEIEAADMTRYLAGDDMVHFEFRLPEGGGRFTDNARSL